MESLSGNVGLNSGTFPHMTELHVFEHQILQCMVSACCIQTLLKSPRMAHDVTRFSVGYIRLGMRLGFICPNPWASSSNVE